MDFRIMFHIKFILFILNFLFLFFCLLSFSKVKNCEPEILLILLNKCCLGTRRRSKAEMFKSE